MATKKKTTKNKVTKKTTSKKTAKKKLAKKASSKTKSQTQPPKIESNKTVKKKAKTQPNTGSTSGNEVSKAREKQSVVEKSNGQPEKKYQRRKIKHIWPEIGTVIIGRLKGQNFRAEIVDDPDLIKSHGKAVRSLDEPHLPLAYTFNEAAQLFTKKVREKHGMKPVANGWKWWRRERDNQRLFDIPEYSQVEE